MPKYDSGKPRFSLIDPKFMLEFAQVMTMGAEKYGADNWKTIENAIPRYKDALHRHLNAFEQGKMDDEESGLSHLAHVAANAMFLYWLALNPREETTKAPIEICTKCAYNTNGTFQSKSFINMPCVTCSIFYGNKALKSNFVMKGTQVDKPERLVIKGCYSCAHELTHDGKDRCMECDDNYCNWSHKIMYSGYRVIDIKTLEITPRGKSDAKTVRTKSDPSVGNATSHGCNCACCAADHEEKSGTGEEPAETSIIFDLRKPS